MITNPALGSFGNQTGEEFLANLIPALVELLLVVGFLAFVFTFLIGGIKWITASGDKGKLEEAKGTLSNALLGLFILFMFFGILSFVECFFGIGLREINIGPFSIGFSTIPACEGSAGTTPAPTGGGTGTTLGSGTGNAACPGCINNGCGIVGFTYLGAGSQNYNCTSSGWIATSNPVNSTTCGSCN